jgi:hypothetical protein
MISEPLVISCPGCTHDYLQIQDARQRFSEMIRAVARDGPQIVTRHIERSQSRWTLPSTAG